MQVKPNIRHINSAQLREHLISLGEKPFRARQIEDWLWRKGVHHFGSMTDISKSLQEQLIAHFELLPLQEDITQVSHIDKTIKIRFMTHDGHKLESVLIPTPTQALLTACVSSQIGCSLTCKFCATGKMERLRNLYADEIFDQFHLINLQSIKHFQKPLTNVVYMGMGEPLLNYSNVISSINRISQYGEFGFSPKRITVSTAGIVKMIRKLGEDEVKFNLALSLHAANDEKRSAIMPINDTNTLQALVKALHFFYNKTGNKITLEYILLNNFNDDIQDAKELIKFAQQLPCKINIIEYNNIGDDQFESSQEYKLDKFVKTLTLHNITVNVRRSRGKDIDAACGQLANK